MQLFDLLFKISHNTYMTVDQDYTPDYLLSIK